MKIPEPLFLIINPTMRLLLRSPLHFLMSRSLLLITYEGRKSGRRYTTPLRYTREGEVIRCFTSDTTQWWRNLQGGKEVSLRVAGKDGKYLAQIIKDDKQTLRAELEKYLAQFPQDAAYHEVGLDANKQPITEDLDRAIESSVVMKARPV